MGQVDWAPAQVRKFLGYHHYALADGPSGLPVEIAGTDGKYFDVLVVDDGYLVWFRSVGMPQADALAAMHEAETNIHPPTNLGN